MPARDRLAARLVAVAWTALWFGGFAVSIWRASTRTWEREPVATERVRLTQLAPPPPPPPPPPAAPTRPDGARANAGSPRPAAPSTTSGRGLAPPRDSARTGAGAGAAEIPPGVPAAAEAGEPCTGPCAERAGAAPAGAGPLSTQQERDSLLLEYEQGALAAALRRPPPAPTGAERDSIWREQAARRAAATTAGRASSATVGAGGRRDVGLPGGGPTAAERARNRQLDAAVLARLERLRSRADSIRWARCDSVAKRDPAAAARDTLCTIAPR